MGSENIFSLSQTVVNISYKIFLYEVLFCIV